MTRIKIMKEKLRRRMTVTSSLKDISTGELGGGGGDATPPTLIPFYRRIFKDDVNGVSSISDS
jgi:hypothetical protein